MNSYEVRKIRRVKCKYQSEEGAMQGSYRLAAALESIKGLLRRRCVQGVLLMLAILPVPAAATEVHMEEVPTDWLLQNYVSGGTSYVVTYYTSSSCTADYGKIIFAGGAQPEVIEKYWATVMTAKMSGKEIFVNYEQVNNDCFIRSFGLPPE